jgi:hypothetical protein
MAARRWGQGGEPWGVSIRCVMRLLRVFGYIMGRRRAIKLKSSLAVNNLNLYIHIVVWHTKLPGSAIRKFRETSHFSEKQWIAIPNSTRAEFLHRYHSTGRRFLVHELSYEEGRIVLSALLSSYCVNRKYRMHWRGSRLCSAMEIPTYVKASGNCGWRYSRQHGEGQCLVQRPIVMTSW